MRRRQFTAYGSWLAVAVQVIAALAIFTMNHWVSLIRHDGDYTPFSAGDSISSLVFDETHWYAVEARRFAQSGHLPWNLDVADVDDRVRSLPLLNGMLVGSIIFLMGNLEVTWMVLHGVLPALMWLLIYRMIRTFSAGPLWPSAGAWVTTVVSFGPRNALLLASNSTIQPIEVTRIPGPSITTLLLLLAVVLTAAALSRGGRLRVTVAGLACGLLFYSYYFSWISMFVGLAALLLVSVAARAAWIGRLFAVVLIGSAAGSGQIGMTLWSVVHSAPTDMMVRVGHFNRSVWPGGLMLFAVSAVLLVVLTIASRRAVRQRPSEPATPLFLAMAAVLVGAGFGCNFQLLSGYQAQHGHFVSRVIDPVGCIMVFAALAFVLRRLPRAGRRACGAAAALGAATCVGLGVYRQVQVAVGTGHDHRASSPRVDMARWLGTNISPDSVVGAFDGHLIALMPAFTGTWTFAPLGNRTTVSDREILMRYLLAAFLDGRDLDRVGEELLAEREHTNRLWPQPVWRHWTRRTLGPELSAALPKMIQEMDAHAELTDRMLDYFVLQKDQSLDRLRSVFPSSAVVYANEAWSVVDVGCSSVE